MVAERDEDGDAGGVDGGGGGAGGVGGDAGEVVPVGVGEEAVALQRRGRGPHVHRERQTPGHIDRHLRPPPPPPLYRLPQPPIAAALPNPNFSLRVEGRGGVFLLAGGKLTFLIFRNPKPPSFPLCSPRFVFRINSTATSSPNFLKQKYKSKVIFLSIYHGDNLCSKPHILL